MWFQTLHLGDHMRIFTVRVVQGKLLPVLEIPFNVPLTEIDSKAEWIVQRLFSLVFTIFIFTFLFLLLLTGLLFVANGTKASPESVLNLIGVGVLAYMICLPFMLGYGYWLTFKGEREELSEVWESLPWFTQVQFARE